MAFEFKECKIKGLVEIQPKVFGDERGYFFESYNERDFFDAGIKVHFVQDNQSLSSKGVLRGLHFQKRFSQDKIVRVISGKVLDVAVDLRDKSPTFGKWHGVVLDSQKQNQFYIPKGFAHGFFTLSDAAIFAYKCSDFYHPEDEGGLIWNDPTINVDWLGAIKDASTIEPILSEKDKKHQLFDATKKYFNADGTEWIGD
ncbi:MAG: dTDP-4-dehydrorhamnose 3,5-epimerase [Treponema sp.]|nr:dTDP-4-dehydrorhamnose 3,5-epimerase [Treponema sp.]MEE3434989.1 dTDP-4-dehydrorhamnose 3,5-epimerase [Treponema sp.]